MKIKMVRVCDSHAEKRWEALSNPAVSQWVFIDLPVSLDKTREWCRTIGGRQNRIDFCFELDEAPVGFAGLVNIDAKSKTCELYIFLHPDYFSKGLGSVLIGNLLIYGILELNIRKFLLYVTSENQSAINFYQKNGFVVEGVLRRQVWFRGGYRDRVIMAKFADDVKFSAENFYSEVLG